MCQQSCYLKKYARQFRFSTLPLGNLTWEALDHMTLKILNMSVSRNSTILCLPSLLCTVNESSWEGDLLRAFPQMKISSGIGLPNLPHHPLWGYPLKTLFFSLYCEGSQKNAHTGQEIMWVICKGKRTFALFHFLSFDKVTVTGKHFFIMKTMHA